jgi:S1-C subfamily serine protease
VPRGTGTGFVWDAAGHIVTNFHVIQEGSGARVTSPGVTLPGWVSGSADTRTLFVVDGFGDGSTHVPGAPVE